MKKDLNLQNVLKETEETLTQPLDQMYTDLDNTIHYGSMPKQVKQQVTAGNPVIETPAPTQTHQPNLDQTHTNTQS
jgi:fibronectin type 3 domain-containing protein